MNLSEKILLDVILFNSIIQTLLKSKALDFSSLMNILINKQTKAPDTAGVCFCYMWVWDQQVKIVKK